MPFFADRAKLAIACICHVIMFSRGIMLFVLVSGNYPYPGRTVKEVLKQYEKKQNRLAFPDSLSKGQAIFVTSLLLYCRACAAERVSSEISDLLLFVSYFASQSKGIKFVDCLFGCVWCKLILFAKMSDTQDNLQYGNKYSH